MPETFLTPAETIKTFVGIGNDKSHLPIGKMTLLGILAGAYIGFGAHLSTTATTGTVDYIGYGLTKVIGGSVFSLGLMLVVIAGAELFTGNNLMTISLLQKRITFTDLCRNWFVVYIANLIGALLVALLVYYAGLNGDGAQLTPVGQAAITLAKTKANLPLLQIVFRGILANWLVCLAVILSTASRDIVSKMMACLFPIMAFVAMGCEHSIANMYFLPAGLLAAHGTVVGLTIMQAIVNIGAATLGNVIGGALFVGVIYWYLYAREQ